MAALGELGDRRLEEAQIGEVPGEEQNLHKSNDDALMTPCRSAFSIAASGSSSSWCGAIPPRVPPWRADVRRRAPACAAARPGSARPSPATLRPPVRDGRGGAP